MSVCVCVCVCVLLTATILNVDKMADLFLKKGRLVYVQGLCD